MVKMNWGMRVGFSFAFGLLWGPTGCGGPTILPRAAGDWRQAPPVLSNAIQYLDLVPRAQKLREVAGRFR
jgi:hypothetical protein